jgi:selenide,water dikinase
VILEIETQKVPRLEGALEAIALGAIPAGLLANREYAECMVTEEGVLDETLRMLMYDPQTSGGLLVSVDAGHAASLMLALENASVPAHVIGRVTAGKPGIVLRGNGE